MTGLPHVSLKRHGLLLAACIAIAFIPGAFGSMFPPDDWYARLEKPALTPPGFVFPIAWTTLYVCIGVALYLFLIATPRAARRRPLAFFATQLVLNGLWSWIFFGLHAVGAALVEIVVLWLAILVTLMAVRRTSPTAAKLLVPYLAWVTFATYLNAAIWFLNR